LFGGDKEIMVEITLSLFDSQGERDFNVEE
jgi:hypothetical protein